jgi:hypothetical protein
MSTDMIINEMYSRPSLASSTASRIETGAKHMQQCRISLSHMLNFLDGDDEQMCKHKELYCLHKDEIAVGVGDSLLKNSPSFNRSVYPFVVSTMGTVNPVALLYKAYNFYNTFALNEHIGALCVEVIEDYLDNRAGRYQHTKDDADRVRKCFVDMRSVGVTTTMGYAHHNSGDTMSTVMIMGLHTTMNGAYPVETGDDIMWYWDFETDVLDQQTGQRTMAKGWRADAAYLWHDATQYDTHTQRKEIKAAFTAEMEAITGDYKPDGRLDGGFKPDKGALPHADKRRRFHDRQQVMGRKPIARVKPFVFDKNGSHPDCRRVFAVALSSARPYEMVDIRISRQSL